MHTYRKIEGGGWQAGYQYAEEPRFQPLGPNFDVEAEAAAFASFLNGGRYSPGEIEHIFTVPIYDEDDDDSTHPGRPKAFDEDYPLRKRK